MRKFKLIKEYPGSDHEGIIVSLKTPNGLYEGYQYNYYSKHVENNPEYWEEVIEKDYEILESCPIEGSIYSVKRLSDGEVFTVGDMIKTKNCYSSERINEIKLTDDSSAFLNGIWFYCEKGCSHFKRAIKAKQPIFLTHDGKDIFVGDRIVWVNKETFCSDYFVPTPSVTFFSDINVYFLTEEAAEGYVYRTKVLFTTEDGVGIKRGDTFYFVDTDLSIGLSNTKYEKCDGRKYFSTFETAQYYMIVNAKVLSIEEFWEFVTKPGSNVVKQKALKRLVKERLNLK